MKKKLSDYIHLYLGCQFYWRWHSDSGVCELTPHELSVYGDYDEVKLILRPLSDMKNEEKIESNSLYHDADLRFSSLNAGKLVKWLLDKHFDLFGLIEAGLALNTKEHKEVY